MMFDKTSRPFFTTATDVSSQLDSIPKTIVSFILKHSKYCTNAVKQENKYGINNW